MRFRADLHCHSTCSDGTDTPKELIDLAVKSDLQGLSITDHDTVAAYEELFPYAKENNIALLPGVEFSTQHDSHGVHILGYAFNPKNRDLKQFCDAHTARRTERCEQILSLLKKEGIVFTAEAIEKLYTQNTIGRPHIALALMEVGAVSSITEAFRRYLGDQAPCYVQGKAFSIEETLEVIHGACGLAILAHPHIIKYKELIPKILSMNLDGLEGYYARFPRKDETPWLAIAKQKGWLITGGSDYHGAVKRNPLGCSWVGKTTFEVLMNHYQAHTS